MDLTQRRRAAQRPDAFGFSERISHVRIRVSSWLRVTMTLSSCNWRRILATVEPCLTSSSTNGRRPSHCWSESLAWYDELRPSCCWMILNEDDCVVDGVILCFDDCSNAFLTDTRSNSSSQKRCYKVSSRFNYEQECETRLKRRRPASCAGVFAGLPKLA